MSSRKRPPADAGSTSQKTPRYAPSTPHARRALEQRTATKRRSVRAQKMFDSTRRPDSTRGILSRLAKITAPITSKRVVTPLGNKENVDTIEQMEDEKEGIQRPQPTLQDISEDDAQEEDSELPAAPTPSILPDEDDPTITFQAIDFARDKGPASERPRRRSSRRSFLIAEDEDETIMTEVGRRARSEGPLDDRPRSSFGSIRMSDFARNFQQRRQSNRDEQIPLRDDGDGGYDFGNETNMTDGAETQDLRRLQISPAQISAGELSDHYDAMQDDDVSFRLQLPEEQQRSSPRLFVTPHGQFRVEEHVDDEDDHDWEPEEEVEEEDKANTVQPASPTRPSPNHTALELASFKPRRKKMKQTKSGSMVPSLPSSLIKRIAIDARTRIGKRKPVLGRDHVKALEQAAEWFFEQVGEDLEVFSNHARRKKRIDESDVLTLMKRQRVLREPGSVHDLAREFLPGDVLKELDLPDHL